MTLSQTSAVRCCSASHPASRVEFVAVLLQRITSGKSNHVLRRAALRLTLHDAEQLPAVRPVGFDVVTLRLDTPNNA